MDIDKLNKWAELLLDTGKRNNLINFKDTKFGTVEIVSPDFDTLFSQAEHSTNLEVYDPQLSDETDDDIEIEAIDDNDVEILFRNSDILSSKSNLPTSSEIFDPKSKDTIGYSTIETVDAEQIENVGEKRIPKENYIATYERRLKKNNQVLAYNAFANPIKVLTNISKKAKTAIEETGVNIAYMTFGFIHWTEDENSQYVMRAPILLIPISIESNSAIDPYHIKITDCDVIVNPTFSFKLKTDYGIELPDYDDEGIESYLEKVENSLAKLKWSVTKECKIGIFSFLKINMYKDLKNNAAKILKNSNVRTLLGEESICISQDVSQDSPNEKTTNNFPLHNVIDADSSQTEAIETARSGKSFVLQGPPGTGKSQTITNIIAECLAYDKKVLFVSEKLAALNVVYDKLKKAGLEEFCLELHSHKANKKDMITELCRTLKSSKSALSDRAQKEIELKMRAQKDLDDYAVELHKVRPVINKSLYKLYEEVSSYRKIPDAEFVIKEIRSKGETYINKAETALTHYVEYTRSVGFNYRQNVWYGYSDLNPSYELTAKLKSDLNDAILLCNDIKALNVALSEKLGLRAANMNQAYALNDLFNLLKSSKFVTPALFNHTVLANTLDTANALSILSQEIINTKKILDDKFDEDVYKLDGSSLYKKLTKQFNGFFSRLFNGEYKRIINELKLCGKDGKKLKYKAAVSITDTLQACQLKISEFHKMEEQVNDCFDSSYNGVSTDFDDLIKELKILAKVRDSGVDFTSLSTLTNHNFHEKQKDFAMFSELLEKSFDKFREAETRVAEKFDLNVYDVRNTEIDVLTNKYRGCTENLDKLDNWCEFVKLLNRLDELELKAFVDYTIDHNITETNVVYSYRKAFCTQWIDAILHESPVLISLSRIPHDETIKLFQTKDELNFEINKAIVKAELSAKRPNLDMIAQGSAISILLREGEKKRKQKGVRTLLQEIGDLVQTLKPCFLMSPLSVSTFLNPEMQFDVVIFDEASQIFPQDAIGAIYRGKQLIVVGDSKQMPPSNFFNASFVQDDADSEADDVTDFESILDICAATLPQKRLKWHYRSRFESLISFSNKNFYDNELITFPSAKRDCNGIGIDYFYVDGTFDRKSKTNRAEAEKIVDLVFENIEKYPERSLGVVAFSISQQNLIDKLIAKRRQQDPSKEPFFKLDKTEPFFVKNLETVQGDERDTIIFSIAYGKDSQGRLLMNFGPLNREGGERRLNVAVTRAKYNVRLVSSMHYTDIDLSKTQSVGAKLLREYLDYAENGEIALSRSVSVNSFDNYDSEFEMEVCEFLREKGFCVDTQVGCSSFKIDMALRRPDSSDYLLAIECDGATYHSSKSARDRDRLRQEILERMGWKFYRIWSTDWFRNKLVEKERLLEAAKAAIDNSVIPPSQNELTPDNVSFEEIAEVKHFEFPKYVMVDGHKAAEKFNYNKLQTICAIAYFESPLSEEWLLKRISFLFGREKVTNVVRDEYNRIMSNCSYYKIVRKNGFLYSQEKEIPMLRIPKENASIVREIKYIALEELSLGIKEILKQNVTVEKNGLFRLLVQQLGFSRMGDTIIARLEESLHLISNDIDFDGDTLSLKQQSSSTILIHC